MGGYGLNDQRLAPATWPRTSSTSTTSARDFSCWPPSPIPSPPRWTSARPPGWEGVEHGPRALEAKVTLHARRTLHKVEPITWHLLVDAAAGKGYDTVIVAKAKSKEGVYARLQAGEWTRQHLRDLRRPTRARARPSSA